MWSKGGMKMSLREIVEILLTGLTTLVFYLCLSIGPSQMNLSETWAMIFKVINIVSACLMGYAVYYIGEMKR